MRMPSAGTVLLAVMVSTAASASAQGPIVFRGEPMTLRGEIVEISCYQKKGVAEGTGAQHAACATDCVKQGKALGILSDGEGLFKITGDLTKENYARLVPHIGQTVELRGVEVRVSNNYDVKSFDAQTVARVSRAK